MYSRQYFVVLARNCLASTLDYKVMQIEKLTVKRSITQQLDYSASLKS